MQLSREAKTRVRLHGDSYRFQERHRSPRALSTVKPLSLESTWRWLQGPGDLRCSGRPIPALGYFPCHPGVSRGPIHALNQTGRPMGTAPGTAPGTARRANSATVASRSGSGARPSKVTALRAFRGHPGLIALSTPSQGRQGVGGGRGHRHLPLSVSALSLTRPPGR